MARKNTRPLEGQESFFEHDVITRSEVIPQQPEETTIPLAGPSVDLNNRSQDLSKALRFLGEMSKRTGLQIAATTPHRQGIEERYGDNTDNVVSGAERKKAEMRESVQGLLWRAGGYTALVKSGLMDSESAKRLAEANFDKFIAKYADSPNRDRRDEYRKRIERNHKIATGQYRRRRKSA